MSRRKHKRRKPISAEEKERRRQLAKERKKRQKLEKKRNIRDAIAITLGIILFSVILILSAIFNEKLLLIFFIASAVILTLLLDQSGIRSLIFRWYPDRFLFADYLKKHDTERAVPMQLANTISWCMFMLIIFEIRYKYIWTIIWLICIGVGLYYMLTTEEYSLEKGAKYECSVLFLLITPTFLLLAVINNVRITIPFIAFTAVFTVIFSIIYAIHIYNGNQVFTRIIYGIIVLSMCASSGFLLINKNLDFSEPKNYTLVIEDKDYSGGKNTTYYIYTQDWNTPNELIDIKVNSDIYHSLEIGDSVIIETHSGSLKAEHYNYKQKAPVQ
ncbi:MAG: hypothetical protein K2J47_03580 [Ruminococcus sp.]|nr:hypothetical protein [Ruminococcus sp.]MDE6788382.1 hypothetical protein [Ruminococcus sp.]